MAMVASGIAAHGNVYKPYLVDQVQAPDLTVLWQAPTTKLHSNVLSPSVADDLTQMMVNVVDRGTGSAARIAGVQVAGKTGTAQSAPNRPPYAWFVSFAPADNPQVAVAVLVQDAGVDRNSITGNGLAAPIARAVMQAVIQ
jgi:peptidoglycan glycosyltransferase